MSLNQQQAITVGSTAGIVGGGTVVVGGQAFLERSETGRSISNKFNDMKNALSNTISSTKFIQSITQSSTKLATTAVGQGLKATGKAVGLGGVDVVMGSMNIAETAKSTSMSEGEKGYSITADVVGAVANIAASLATGPLAVLLIIGQVLGALLDSFVNPFKNYFNRDLRDMRAAYDAESKRSFVNLGINWPLEVKPDLIGTVFGDAETTKEYQKYLQEYYYDKGLITEEQFLEDFNILLDLRKLRRFNKKFITNEQGEIIGMKSPSRRSLNVLSDLEDNLLEIEDDVNQNMLLMLALAAFMKKQKLKGKPSRILQYIQINYISIIVSVITIIISVVISSILSVSIK